MAADAKMAHPPSSRFTPLNVHWTFTLWERSFTFVSLVVNRSHGLIHLFKVFTLTFTSDEKNQDNSLHSGNITHGHRPLPIVIGSGKNTYQFNRCIFSRLKNSSERSVSKSIL